MTPESIRRLYDYSAWAFERMWACVLVLTDEQFTQELTGPAWSIRDHVVHLISSATRWIGRAEGADLPPHLDFEDYPTRALARSKWDEMQAWVSGYIAGLDQAHLDEVVEWSLPARGISCASPRWELLLHLANHATDHRAQILTLLPHQFGVATVEQDMTLYMAEIAASRSA